jgi:hypothetical protein
MLSRHADVPRKLLAHDPRGGHAFLWCEVTSPLQLNWQIAGIAGLDGMLPDGGPVLPPGVVEVWVGGAIGKNVLRFHGKAWSRHG